ncbi:hypothetical protein HMPREF1318_2495 [Actinomyces massiliensis F0489]|uniref:Uncharacterized protein n=1 Tax=Actinomyces massiliensis F0489 TaxID=1125718 RepID=J0NBU7_9ACTO|nr:hypothetical protein HMPREF1318_2495 [Actinomyces massiliensis F0489]
MVPVPAGCSRPSARRRSITTKEPCRPLSSRGNRDPVARLWRAVRSTIS